MAKELVEKVFKKFEEHLNLPNNNRIIFSGKFGIGKSYFLNEFFKEEKYDKEYFVIKINPVNYSIATNQDIFELIKFDILFQILDKNIIDFDHFEFATENLIYQYFSNKFLKDFVSNVDLLGEVVIDEQLPKSYSILKNLGKLISKITEVGKNDFDKFKKEIEANPDLKIIQDLFDNEQLKLGSLYENNAVTQLVYQLIKSIEEKTEKKTVLLIDDLDRIDPEHIFRILNIFSAHDIEGENKFGIEKIILVCDLNNIESIYHHFYGEKADFYGYIDKFYSLRPFYYFNEFYTDVFAETFKIPLQERLKVDGDRQSFKGIYLIELLIDEGIRKNIITARQLFSKNYSFEHVLEIFHSHYQLYESKFYHFGNKISEIFKGGICPFLMTLRYFFEDESQILKIINSIEREKLILADDFIAELLAFSNLCKPESNIIFSNLEMSLRTNEYGKFKLIDKLQILNADLKKIFEKAFIIIDEITIK